MARIVSYIIFLTALACAQLLYAQDTVEDAVRSRVLFEDDFSGDSVGAWPAKWIADTAQWKLGVVVRDNGIGKVFRSQDTDDCTAMRPRIDMNGLRSDSMSITFDAFFEKAASDVAFSFFSYSGKGYDAHFRIENRGDDGVFFQYSRWGGACSNKKIQILGTGRWHRIKLAFYAGSITFLLDNRVEASFPDEGCYPGFFYIHLCRAVRISKFKLKAVQGDYDFRGIANGEGIVTHALQFDPGKAAIKREHTGFLVRLSDFLKANPTIKLEIAGHTDSDGDATTNLKLSQDRADAIKAYLTSKGINASRLQTKGYGASKPLQPNTSPEAKANNRRVAFRKL